MAGQADGSIIVDTELNSDGFKAGSAELLAAIKSLSNEVKDLGKTLRETFGGNDKGVSATDNKVQALEATISSLQAEVESLKSTITELEDKLNHLGGNKLTETPVDGIAEAAQGADAQVTALQAKIRELESTIAAMQSELEAAFAAPANVDFDTDAAEAKIASLESKVEELERTIAALQAGGATATPTANFSGTSAGASNLQRQVESVSSSVSRLEMTFQRAMGGSEAAMDSFAQKASVLDDRIDSLQAELAAIGQTQFPTQEYVKLSSEVQKLEQKFDGLLARQEKMQAMGVKMDSAQWKTLQYDMEIVSNKYHELIALKQQLEASGMAFQTGADTSQYQHLVSLLDQASGRLAEMRAGLSSSSGFMTGLASGAKSVFSWISRAARTVGGSLVSGIRSAAAHMKKLVTQSKLMKRPLENMSFLLRRIAPSLLMTEGLFGLLRKAVNAFLQENEQLAANLNACWSGIGNILGPIITRLITLVSTAVAYITQFLALLGFVGKSTTKAIGSAGGAASKETDKLKRQLASFDELNILSDNSSDSGGGGGSSTPEAETPDVTLPDWVKTMVDHLKSGDWSAAATVLTEQLNNMVASVDWAGVGSNIAYWLDGALEFLATAILTFDWYNLGASLAEMINSIIYGVDWANLGIVLGWKFIAIIEGLGGLFATIDWAALGRALASGFMGLWNAIDWKQAAKTLSDGIKGVLNGLSSAIKGVDWRKLGNDVATYIANIDWAGVFTALADGIGAAFGGLGAFLCGLFEDALDSAVGWWYDVAYEDGQFTIEGLLQGIWDGICDIGNWIWTNICEPFISGIKEGFGIASPSTVMQEVGGFIVEGLLLGLQNAWTSLGTWIQEAFTGLTTTITNWASEATQSISTWANDAKSSISTWASSAKRDISSWASDAKSNVKNWASNTKSNIAKWVDNTKSSISSWASTTKSNITKWTSEVKSNVSSWASNAKSTISTWASNTKSNISTWAANTKSNITSWASSTKSSISSWASNMYSTIQSKTNSVKSTLSSGFATAKNSIVNNMRTAMNTVKSQNWYSVGSNICSGIRNGINAGWSWLRTTVSNLARNLLNAAKSALGIHSPSTLFRDAVGLNIGYGVGEGIEAAEGSVLDSVVGVADAIAGEFSANEYSIGGVVSNTDVDSALTAFSDKIASSFTSLLDRLQTIADSAAFKVPTVATGAVPFSTSATVNGGGNGASVSDSIEASNEALSSVVIQSITNATAAIVTAIQNYSGTTVNLDADSLSDSVISEINRKTRMNGKSPLLI